MLPHITYNVLIYKNIMLKNIDTISNIYERFKKKKNSFDVKNFVRTFANK